MNMTLNSLAPTPAALDAAPVTASVPAADAQPASSAAPALAAVAPAAFAQWLGLGQQIDAVAPSAAMPVAENAGATQTEPAESADQPSAPAQQEVVLLAAMSMPLMAPPPAPAFIRGASAPPADPQGSDRAPGAALPLTAAELRTGLATAAVPTAAVPTAALPTAAVPTAAVPTAALPAGGAVAPPAKPRGAGAAADPLPPAAAAPPVPAQPMSTAAPAQPVSAPAMPAQSAPAPDSRHAADAAQVADGSAAPATDRPVGGWGVGGAAPAPARVTADSVALAGPPAAWRQTLHEALGERLNLQLSNRAEQAVIRLEPPMLGRVDIAIRHSAGTLEVTISATHGEVLRQLHAVSENLRSDLAQRQFTEVAVTVAQAPRGAQAAPQGDQQGRGRQPGRDDQPQDPGRALADAGDSSSTFSLNGRA